MAISMSQQRGLVVLLWVVLGIAPPALAQEPKEVPAAEEHRPRPLPDRVILTWKADPARTQAVSWRTDTSVRRGVAQLAVAEVWTRSTQTAKEVQARTRLLQSDLGDAHYHTAH